MKEYLRRYLFLTDVHQDVCAGNADDYAIDVERAGVWHEVDVRVFPPAGIRWGWVDIHVECVLITRNDVNFCVWAVKQSNHF